MTVPCADCRHPAACGDTCAAEEATAGQERREAGERCGRCRHTYGVHTPHCRLEAGCKCAAFIPPPVQAVLPLEAQP